MCFDTKGLCRYGQGIVSQVEWEREVHVCGLPSVLRLLGHVGPRMAVLRALTIDIGSMAFYAPGACVCFCETDLGFVPLGQWRYLEMAINPLNPRSHFSNFLMTMYQL